MGKQSQPDPSPISKANSKNWAIAFSILSLFWVVISFSKTTSPVTLNCGQLQFLFVNMVLWFCKEFVSSVMLPHYNKSTFSEYCGGERVREKGCFFFFSFRKVHLHIIQVQGKASGIKPRFLSKASKTLCDLAPVHISSLINSIFPSLQASEPLVAPHLSFSSLVKVRNRLGSI